MLDMFSALRFLIQLTLFTSLSLNYQFVLRFLSSLGLTPHFASREGGQEIIQKQFLDKKSSFYFLLHLWAIWRFFYSPSDTHTTKDIQANSNKQIQPV